jgi:hypothetical protein
LIGGAADFWAVLQKEHAEGAVKKPCDFSEVAISSAQLSTINNQPRSKPQAA